MIMSAVDVCIVCQIPATQLCSACKLVKYCGAQHQRAHWKQHKTECRPFRVTEDPVLGRHLQATRDVKANTVLFTEAPIVVGPKWYLTELEREVPLMPCVGCFQPCRIGVYSCPKCHWPTCSTNCAGIDNPSLHGMECSLLMLGPGPSNHADIRSLIDYYRSDALLVLKCLVLQRTHAKKWADLMDMQSHEHERIGTELQQEAEQRIVSYLQKNFLNRLHQLQQQRKQKLLENFDAKTVHRICGIIETNYMCIQLQTGLELSGVYYTACMMEHSCMPNCYFQFDQRNGFKISVIAGRDIKKGEHIKIMYTNMLWATQMRHEHLNITKHFLCKCERCADPTECGTYFSALRCVGDIGTDCTGMQLPKDPLNDKTDWVCNTCPIVISGDEVRYLLTQMTEEVEDLLSRKPTIKQLELLIAKLSKFLHPNHYHLFSLKHSLIQLYGTEIGYSSGNLSELQLKNKMEICKGLLDTCHKLDPHTIRLSIYVGIILYEMYTVLLENGKRLIDLKTDMEENKAKALDYFKSGHEHLLCAAKYLEKELDNVAGSKLSDKVLRAIFDLETITKNNS